MRKHRTHLFMPVWWANSASAQRNRLNSNPMENQIAFIIVKLNNVNKSVRMCDTVRRDPWCIRIVFLFYFKYTKEIEYMINIINNWWCFILNDEVKIKHRAHGRVMRCDEWWIHLRIQLVYFHSEIRVKNQFFNCDFVFVAIFKFIMSITCLIVEHIRNGSPKNVKWWRKMQIFFSFKIDFRLTNVDSRRLLKRGSLHWTIVNQSVSDVGLYREVSIAHSSYFFPSLSDSAFFISFWSIFFFLFSNLVFHNQMRAKFGHQTIDKEPEHKQVFIVFTMLWPDYSLHYESILFSAIVCHHSHLNEHTPLDTKQLRSLNSPRICIVISLLFCFPLYFNLFVCRSGRWCILTEFNEEMKRIQFTVILFIFFFGRVFISSVPVVTLWLLCFMIFRANFFFGTFHRAILSTLSTQHLQLLIIICILELNTFLIWTMAVVFSCLRYFD